MSNLFVGLIALGTFAVTIIAVIILIRIKKQQALLYKPDLYFDGFAAEAFNIPIMGINDLFEFKRYKLNYLNDPIKQFDNDYYVSLPYQLRNMGMGVAKNVKVKWHFDLVAAQNNLDKLLPENFEFELLDETLWLRNNEQGLFDCMDFAELDKGHFDYILPTSKGINCRDEAIPKPILSCYLYNFIFSNKLHEDKFAPSYYYDFEGLQKPVLEVSYTDINDKPFKKRFEVELTIISPVENDGSRNEVDGRLQLGILSLVVKEV
jgi:hypothetical protein